MTNVLLVGPWAPYALAFARSLRRRHVGVYLLNTSAERVDFSVSSSVNGGALISEELLGTTEGLDLIAAFARQLGASALVAAVDRDLIWLAAHRERFEPACRVLAPAAESLVSISSKIYQAELARSIGLPILPTFVFARMEDAGAVPAAQFPLVVRPDRREQGSSQPKALLVRSADELRETIRGYQPGRAPLLGQAYKPLPNVVVHGVRSVGGDIIATRCYLVARKFQGVSLTVEPCSFPRGLEARCREFVERAEITGCYHFEFLLSPEDNCPYFLEVNVRLGGTTDKVYRTGFDEPSLLLECYGIPSEPAVALPIHRRRRVVNKRTLLKHIVWAAEGKLTELDYPAVGRWTHIAYSCRDLLFAQDSVFDWRDVPGSIAFHLRDLLPASRGPVTRLAVLTASDQRGRT
jgi:hypothetical protein